MDMKMLRERRGLTQDALALIGGVDTSTVSRLEAGLTRPRPATVVKLARGLGLSARRMAAICAESSKQSEPAAQNEGRPA
jgi:transcriptional regulator with XRE-family HTH domain